MAKTCPKMAQFLPRLKFLFLGRFCFVIRLIWGFFGVGSSFMTFVTTFNYAFSPYSVYPVSILGVFCWYPNFGPIELYFMANMGFFGVENYFLTFITTFE